MHNIKKVKKNQYYTNPKVGRIIYKSIRELQIRGIKDV